MHVHFVIALSLLQKSTFKNKKYCRKYTGRQAKIMRAAQTKDEENEGRKENMVEFSISYIHIISLVWDHSAIIAIIKLVQLCAA